MSRGKLFTNEDVSYIVSKRVNRLNDQIHQLEMDNIKLHNSNIELNKQIEELRKENKDDKRDKRPSIFTTLRQYQ